MKNTEQHMTDIQDAKKDLASITNYYRVDGVRPILLARKTIKDLIYTYLDPQKKVSTRVGQKQYQKKYAKPDKRHQATDSRVQMKLNHLIYKENHLRYKENHLKALIKTLPL